MFPQCLNVSSIQLGTSHTHISYRLLERGHDLTSFRDLPTIPASHLWSLKICFYDAPGGSGVVTDLSDVPNPSLQSGQAEGLLRARIVLSGHPREIWSTHQPRELAGGRRGR